MEENKNYSIFIGRDMFPDPQKYPNGIAYRSDIYDEDGENIDGGGDIATYAEAKELLLNTLERLL